jgi:Xaa-Pro dipeptidase
VIDDTRKAARASDAGTPAAIKAIRDGASDYEVLAEWLRATILTGSEYPGFGPFIRPTRRLGEEHTTWGGDVFHNGNAVFLEIAAAYRKYQAPMGRLIYVGSRGLRRSRHPRHRPHLHPAGVADRHDRSCPFVVHQHRRGR